MGDKGKKDKGKKEVQKKAKLTLKEKRKQKKDKKKQIPGNQVLFPRGSEPGLQKTNFDGDEAQRQPAIY